MNLFFSFDPTLIKLQFPISICCTVYLMDISNPLLSYWKKPEISEESTSKASS